MEKSNQHPKTEDCLAEGEPIDLQYFRLERPTRSVSRENREPQAGPASGSSKSASKESNASGEGDVIHASNTESSVRGAVDEGLPGAKSVASEAGDTRNEGCPAHPCRAN